MAHLITMCVLGSCHRLRPFQAGQPCPLDKWYSHSALAWVVRQRHSMVMLPAALFDHDDQCPCLAKKHSRSALHNVFTIKTPGRMGPQAVAVSQFAS